MDWPHNLPARSPSGQEICVLCVVFGHGGHWGHLSDGFHFYDTVAEGVPIMPTRKAPLGKFLFDYLHKCGVRHSFGVPGDFALPTFAWLDKSPIQSITMCHEPGAGFAADAYSRINGIGLVCVTYCVGGLNVLECHRRRVCGEIAGRGHQRRAGKKGSRERSAAAPQGQDVRYPAPGV